ncbi:MAG: hypothetical protein WDN01_14000 [Rhizomicrobium sp.]
MKSQLGTAAKRLGATSMVPGIHARSPADAAPRRVNDLCGLLWDRTSKYRNHDPSLLARIA